MMSTIEFDELNLRREETILLVDDDIAILDLAKEILEGHGYSTFQAGTGEEALTVFKEKKNQIDLVMLDINMPGMGGEQCLDELRIIDDRVKVIIASGDSVEARVQQFASGVIEKPYRLAEVVNIVRNVLDGELRGIHTL